MDTRMGLYVTLLPDGKIKKRLTDKNGETEEYETTIADEVIMYASLNYDTYMQVVAAIYEKSFYLVEAGKDVFDKVDMRIFERVILVVQEMVTMLYKHNPVTSILLTLQLSDFLPKDDGSAMFAYNARDAIGFCLEQVVLFQTTIINILNNLAEGIPVDMKNEYFYLRSSQFVQIVIYDGELSTQYYFRSETDYCRFLILHFMASKPTVARCRCCGRFFIPKTKKKTLYCDRVVQDGKTCKELAPRLRHRLLAQNTKVIEEFDRAKQRMYRRRERSGYGKKKTDKDLTFDEYYAWMEKATAAREQFLKGEITEEEALSIINES